MAGGVENGPYLIFVVTGLWKTQMQTGDRLGCLDIFRFVSPGRSDGCSDGVQGSILRGNNGTDGNSVSAGHARTHLFL